MPDANATDSTDPLARYIIRLGDDALILGQRLCEWSSNAPTLEEDLALSNVALDFLGRARMLYGYAAEMTGGSEDELAFTRDERQYENLLLVELPRGDFAFTMMRQFLLDTFEASYFAALRNSADPTLAAIAAKTVKEVDYHLRRSRDWIRRLGLGTEESQQRLQAATDELWGYVDELFETDDVERSLIGRGIAVDREAIHDNWHAAVATLVSQSGITLPESPWQVSGGRQGVHTEHLGHLLSEMQYLQRAHPGQQW